MRQLQTGDFSILNTFNANFLKDHYPKWTWQEILHYKNEHLGQDTVGTDPHTTYQHGPGQIRDTQNDYEKFIPRMSNGLTIKSSL